MSRRAPDAAATEVAASDAASAGERIRFNLPHVAARTGEYLAQSLASGTLCGDGPFTREATAALSKLVDGRPLLLTTSCTHALELAWLLLDIAPGDEVVMPSFTFVSTANAVALRGGVPVFVDIRPDTLNLDERLVEQAITARTRAICVVHYGGVACQMDQLSELAARHGIALVEDNAHGLGGSFLGRPLGSLGDLAAQSFHETKNLQCGEGGALVLSDNRLMERAEVLREKGTNRSRFIRGAVDKYTWVNLGSSYLPSDLLAAVLLAGLDEFDAIQARRQAIWTAYDNGLRDWAADKGIELATIPPGCVHPAHLFRLVMPTGGGQGELIAHLAAAGIQATFHYLPLHDSEAGHRYARLGTPCPVTEQVSSRLVRLPLHPGLTDEQVERVVAAVLAFGS